MEEALPTAAKLQVVTANVDACNPSRRPGIATELVHIGQTVMGCSGTVDYLVDAVFNYPTLAESYKVAALDAVNKMRAIAKVTQTGIYHPLPE